MGDESSGHQVHDRSVTTGGGRTPNRKGETVPHRLLVLLTFAAALLAATTAGASITLTPTIARGQTLHIRIATQERAECVAIVNYAYGVQFGALKYAVDGRLSWAIPVARSRPLGHGSWSVQCGLTKERTGAFIVVNASAAG